MFESQEEKYAYGIGAIEKLAEYDISADEFIAAARSTESYSMRKVASLIEDVKDDYLREKQAQQGANALRNMLREKQAFGGLVQGAKNLGGTAMDAAKSFGGSVKSMAQLPGEALNYRRTMNMADEAQDIASSRVGQGQMDAIQGDLDFARDWAGKNLRSTFDQAKPAMTATGVAGAGGAGYAMGSGGGQPQQQQGGGYRR